MTEHLERRIDELAESATRHAIDLRRALHRHPELGWQEVQTQATIREHLKSLGVEAHPIATTGLVAEVGQGERTVLYRADIDALPVEDGKTLGTSPVVSEVEGVCHACGHDLHTALSTALVDVFRQLGSDLPGKARFVYQPAEEVLPSGAEAVVEQGGADGVVACLGVHADPMRQVGHVGLKAGPMTAAGDAFEIVVRGKGGHASRPYLARNPIVAATRAVGALHSIVSQRVDPLEPAVVTVTRIHGGSANNVIPGCVELGGTIRTFTTDTRRRLHAAIEEVAQAAGITQECEVEVKIHLGAPGLVNDVELHALMERVASEALGVECIENFERPSVGSEDFSFFGTRAPTYMMRLGVRRPGHQAAHLHSPTFDPDESAITVGVRVMGRALLRLMAGQG
ncbi:MAG: M20 family metallopeptidase [Deltaproteobacteria bacterium]|nr:M20 family metallopeptidase [Deltaproteobacteria bacterium]